MDYALDTFCHWENSNYSHSIHQMKYNLKVVLQVFKDCGLPEPKPEYVFAPPRKWRFDFAWNCNSNDNRYWTALEVEGGIFMKVSGHRSITGMKRDMEKYNEAAALGWRVIRVRPEELLMQDTINLIKRCLNL